MKEPVAYTRNLAAVRRLLWGTQTLLVANLALLFLGAQTLLHCEVFYTHSPVDQLALQSLWLAAFASLLGLLGVWLVLGPESTTLRVGGALFGLVLLGLTAGKFFDPFFQDVLRVLGRRYELVNDGRDEVSLFLGLQLLAFVAILCAACVHGLRLQRIAEDEPVRAWQFSLRYLLLWVCLAPPGIYLLIWAARPGPRGDSPLAPLLLPLLLVSGPAIWLLCLSAWLRPGGIGARGLLSLLAAAGLGVVVGMASPAPDWLAVLHSVVCFVLFAALFGGSLYVVRLCGYRLHWKRNALRAATPSKVDDETANSADDPEYERPPPPLNPRIAWTLILLLTSSLVLLAALLSALLAGAPTVAGATPTQSSPWRRWTRRETPPSPAAARLRALLGASTPAELPRYTEGPESDLSIAPGLEPPEYPTGWDN